MQNLVRKQHPNTAVAAPPAAINWKAAAIAIALGVLAYVIVLLRVMTLTLVAMHGDITDMRVQLHRTTAALGQTNERLVVVNRHLVTTDQELSGVQRGLFFMRGDVQRMTHRIVHAKLLF
jgi:hypothetical protein